MMGVGDGLATDRANTMAETESGLSTVSSTSRKQTPGTGSRVKL